MRLEFGRKIGCAIEAPYVRSWEELNASEKILDSKTNDSGATLLFERSNGEFRYIVELMS